MTLQEGMLRFDFTGAIRAFKFDEENHMSTNFHGLSHCMKAVDFIVEYENYYIFIEIKDPPDPSRYETEKDKTELINNLVVKFRDTFLYRWAEKRLDKPVYYQCLVELDNAQTLYIMNQLKNQLPAERRPSRWKQSLVKACMVANVVTWNKNFPNMQVKRITGVIP